MALTPEEKIIGRRNFLKAAAALPAVGAVAFQAKNLGPVKTGIVGTGMQGRILISQSDSKYLYIHGLCDIRPDNLDHGYWAIAQPELGHNPQPVRYPKYEDMLADPDIEAVMIVTPLHMHAPMAIQALHAGKHVFIEKTMAYSIDDCRDMIQLARQKNLNLQIGHQRFYNPLYWDAYKMMNEGLLGDVYHIRAMWNRNTDWNYWSHVHKASSPSVVKKLKQFDPSSYGYPDLQKLVNWRWYRQYSHGLWTELCSHQIAIANWLFGSTPAAVYACGGKYKSDENQDDLYIKYEKEFEVVQEYNDEIRSFEQFIQTKKEYSKDDRTVDDHIYALFEYPKGRTVSYTAIQSSSVDNYYEQIMGTRGTILLENENETYLFWEPGWDETKAKLAAGDAKNTQVEMVQETESQSAFAAHVSQQASRTGGATGMSPLEPYKWELQGFAHSIRTGAPNLCDGVRGAEAALACLEGEKSLQNRQRRIIPSLG
ncbi:MAG: Gfo/Idh/MocA family oxidoreductase [Candidatus Omnitrophica bacterium]|nr:Gfo/Idh/MocA family oxidoreductase [Candidatus Omnitrophota bacterium]